ncbi:trichohyalin [Monomorium pharaonis]|uniref:trichohyalin n=1 Tax=Monomorium pharaonis TaxID=307658 RepID=UPI00063EEC8F|nr:trichohyalin [Monomorium pharaonis]
MDKFSKHVRLFPMTNQKLETIIERIREYFGEMTIPKEVLTDNGGQFITDKWQSFAEEMGFTAKKTTPYNPQSNPMERVMRELGRIIRAYASHRQGAWSKIIVKAKNAINNTVHASTGFTPNELQNNRTDNFGLAEALLPRRLREMTWNEKIKQARANLRRNAEKRKRQADKREHAKPYEEGQKVWVKLHRQSDANRRVTKKIHLVYDGPYYVLRVLRRNAYLIGTANGTVKGAYNTRQLRPDRSAKWNKRDDIDDIDERDDSQSRITSNERTYEDTRERDETDVTEEFEEGEPSSEINDVNENTLASESDENESRPSNSSNDEQSLNATRIGEIGEKSESNYTIERSEDSTTSERSEERDATKTTERSVIPLKREIVSLCDDDQPEIAEKYSENEFEQRVKSARGQAYRVRKRRETRNGSVSYTLEQGYNICPMVRIPCNNVNAWIDCESIEYEQKREKTKRELIKLDHSLKNIESEAKKRQKAIKTRSESAKAKQASEAKLRSALTQAIELCKQSENTEEDQTWYKLTNECQIRARRRDEGQRRSSPENNVCVSKPDSFRRRSGVTREEVSHSTETTVIREIPSPENQLGNPLLWDISPILDTYSRQNARNSDQPEEEINIYDSSDEASAKFIKSIESEKPTGKANSTARVEPQITDRRSKLPTKQRNTAQSAEVTDKTVRGANCGESSDANKEDRSAEKAERAIEGETSKRHDASVTRLRANRQKTRKRGKMNASDFQKLLEEEEKTSQEFKSFLRDRINVARIRGRMQTMRKFMDTANITDPTPSQVLEEANERSTIRDPTLDEDEELRFYVLMKFERRTLSMKQVFTRTDRITTQDLDEITEDRPQEQQAESEKRKEIVRETSESDTEEERKRERQKKRQRQQQRAKKTKSDWESEPVKRSTKNARKPLRRKDRKIDGRSTRKPESYVRGQGGKFASKPKITDVRVIIPAKEAQAARLSKEEHRFTTEIEGESGKGRADQTKTGEAKQTQELRAEMPIEPRPSTSREIDP